MPRQGRLTSPSGQTLAHTLEVSPELTPLYDHLARRGSFVHLDNANPAYAAIFSRDVLKRIAAGDEGGERMVSPQVVALIRKRGCFGCVPL